MQSSRYQSKFGNKAFTKQKPNSYRKGQNHTDRFQNYLKCNIFESINHLSPKWLDQNSSHDTYNITLYQSNLNSDNSFKRLAGESFWAAILDSGASKTLCRRTGIDCYTESLSGKEKELVKHKDNENVFTFGDGEKSSP